MKQLKGKKMADVTAVNRMRNIVNWLDNHSEFFNDRIKSISDVEKIYDYCCKYNIEFLDDCSVFDKKEYLKIRREIKDLLGYYLV